MIYERIIKWWHRCYGVTKSKSFPDNQVVSRDVATIAGDSAIISGEGCNKSVVSELKQTRCLAEASERWSVRTLFPPGCSPELTSVPYPSASSFILINSLKKSLQLCVWSITSSIESGIIGKLVRFPFWHTLLTPFVTILHLWDVQHIREVSEVQRKTCQIFFSSKNSCWNVG